MSEDEFRQTAAALSLIQRLPPQDIEKNLKDLQKIAPHLENGLEPYVNRPFGIKRDPSCNKYFIACDYNNNGGSYRSPWSNKYIPPLKDDKGGEADDSLSRPSERVRHLEETFNEVFNAYKTAYYEGGVSSVYLWDLEEGFAGAFVIRKELMECHEAKKGVWESSHVLEVRESPNSNFAEFKLSSTVRVEVTVGDKQTGESDLSGLITRQAESRCDRRKKASEDMHLLQVGRMIEEMELSIRQSLDSFYMAKQHEVLNSVRSLDVVSDAAHARREAAHRRVAAQAPKAKAKAKASGSRSLTATRSLRALSGRALTRTGTRSLSRSGSRRSPAAAGRGASDPAALTESPGAS